MKITTKVSYGVRLMLYLALNYGKGSVFLREIALQEVISEKYLSQIVIPLKAAGLVDSVRGAHGGYMLNREPFKISVWDIVESLEGELNFVKRTNNFSSQSETYLCINRMVWEKLEKNMSHTLEVITLADLATAYTENNKNGIMYNI